METVIPKTSTVLTALLRADFTTQWRNRRAVVLTLVVPVIILVSWKGLVATLGGPFALSNSITIGLFASGLMGYSNSVARDRDKGIFQRLRVAPLSSWMIMISRLIVQLVMILLVTTVVFIIGKDYDKVTLTPGGYLLTYFTSIAGGAVALSLGQMVVGWIKNPETVNSTSRLVYLAFIIIGMFGELHVAHVFGNPNSHSYLDTLIDYIVQWSPYGAVKIILSAGMEPGKWDMHATNSLLLTLGYTIIFTIFGVKWFKWSSR